MNLTERDRRALVFLGVALAISLTIYFWPEGKPEVVEASGADSIPMAERRLQKTRELAATIPAKEKVLQEIEGQVAGREKGLIEDETAQQAQARIVQLLRKIARAQSPPLELGAIDLGNIRPLGDHYAEAVVTVSAQCQIEQVVNLLADLSAQPELIATNEIQLRTADQRRKTVAMRLTVTGVLPRRQLPAQRPGGTLF